MASRDETLQEFLAITDANEAKALQMLESCDWNLQQAVELFFATSGGDGGAGGAGGGGAGPSDNWGGGGGGLGDDDDGVRAPMPTKVDRLYGDGAYVPHHHPHHGGGGGGGRGAGGFDAHEAALHGLGMVGGGGRAGGGRRGGGLPALDPGPAHVNAFRAAGGAGGSNRPTVAASAASPTAAAANDHPSSSAGNAAVPNLASLFEPPTDLLFRGDFEAAKQAAADQSRWLLVNVQSGSEFASHRLNRDTWRHPLVADVVKASFVFWQAFDTSPDGGRVAAYYHVGAALPAVLVVDPITGAAVWSTAARRSAAGGGAGAAGGFVSPETMLEELAPFTDVGPSDPDAGALAARHERRVQAAKAAAQAAQAASGGGKAGGGSGAGGAGGGGGAGRAAASVPAEFMTEDEQLAAALAASAREAAAAGGGGSGGGGAGGQEEQQQQQGGSEGDAGGGGFDDDGDGEDGNASPAAPPSDDDLDEAAIWAEVARREAAAARPPPEQVQAEALARLPAEPAPGAPGSCRVAVRLPDGQRLARAFDGARDTVAALRDLCLAHCAEAAGGRAFALSEAVPGSAPLPESGDGRLLAEAGLANVQLALRWVD
jgi:hypothetical protein